MTEGTCVDEALGERGAKEEAQEPWCKQERFLNQKDSWLEVSFLSFCTYVFWFPALLYFFS